MFWKTRRKARTSTGAFMGGAVSIQTKDGDLWGDVAFPTETSAPVVVVLHEVFGVNEDISQTCRELAEAGLIAIAPELFWRQARSIDLNAWSNEEWSKGLALYTDYNHDIGVRDVLTRVRAAQQLEDATENIGVMDFCLGGLMAYPTAARHEPDAAFAYRGRNARNDVDEAYAIATPLLMHLAKEDECISKDAQGRVKAILVDAPDPRPTVIPPPVSDARGR